MSAPGEDLSSRQRARINALGLALGGVAVAIMIACIVSFTILGLPKDPEMMKRQSQQQHSETSPSRTDQR